MMEAMTLQKKGRGAEYIPTELVEKILLNLPLKSLTRFASVSKSWKSTIHSRDFEKRYRGREMVIVKRYRSDSDEALVYPLSSILSGKPIANCPQAYPRVRASCGELWCVEFDYSICLYNPTMGICRKLPKSPTITSWRWRSESETDDDDDDDDDVDDDNLMWRLYYGLGYDSVTDDYKVLAFDSSFTLNELYSKRGESWRILSGMREHIQVCTSFSHDRMNFLSEEGVFVNGLLHWLICYSGGSNYHCVYTIISFDLSTEKYGKVVWPDPLAELYEYWVDLGVLRGRLCVYSDDWEGRGVMWVRDRDDERVWIKEAVINCSHIFPETYTKRLKPLYSYNSSIKAFVAHDIPKIILYEDEDEDEATQLVEKDFGSGILECITYVESMVKP